MKQPTLFFFVLCLSATLLAQPQKGSYLIGGSGSFQHQKGISNAVILEPNIGYFISNRFVLGLKPRFEHQRWIGDFAGDFRTTLSIGPYARYYFAKTGKAMVFAEAEHTRYRTYFPPDFFYNGNATRLGAGVDIFLNDEVALETTISQIYQNDVRVFGSASNLDLISLKIGLQFFLTRHSIKENKQTQSLKRITKSVGRGTVLVGVSGANENYEDVFKNTQMSILSGYFLQNWFVIGLNTYSDRFRNIETGRLHKGINLAPFTRFYIPQSRKWMLFGETKYERVRYKNQTSTSKGRAFSAGLGFDLFVNQAVAFEMTLTKRRLRYASSYKLDQTTVSFGFQFFL